MTVMTYAFSFGHGASIIGLHCFANCCLTFTLFIIILDFNRFETKLTILENYSVDFNEIYIA